MKLRTWQQQCLNAWESNNFRGIVNVVTGAGKTFLALSAMDLYRACYPEARIRIVVPTIPLARQWQTALLHHAAPGSEPPGLFGAGYRDSVEKQVMIYIINSARDVLSNHIRKSFALQQHVLLICDECHHYQSPQNRKIFSFISSGDGYAALYASLGLSATPFGTGNDHVLLQSLGREIYRYGFSQAVEDQVIAPFIVSETAVSFLPKEKARYQKLSREIALLLNKLKSMHPELSQLSPSAFIRAVMKLAQAAGMDPEDPAAAFLLKTWERKEVCVLAESRLFCALDLIANIPSGQRVLIFCERIQQAEEMASVLRRSLGNGICGLYHSRMSGEARRRILEAFRDNHFRVLVSCRCLDEGIDVPDASVGIVLSSTAVSRQRIQRLGRILRRSDGKQAGSLYYLYIQESSEEMAYLPGLENNPCFPLRYDSRERSFANDAYEYAALQVLSDAKSEGYGNAQLAELRRCLLEGLTRSDCLLPPSAIRSQFHNAASRRERNYWKTMHKLNRLLT